MSRYPHRGGVLEELMTRSDVEDVQVDGPNSMLLRLTNGGLVPCPPIASSDTELARLLAGLLTGDRADSDTDRGVE